jgi:hypothetical protein
MNPPGFQPPTNAVAPVEGEVSSLVTRGGASDAALMEVSVKIARAYPRDERKIVDKLRTTLALYPQFAEKALYSIPYKENRSGRQVKVEGLTIRAAETLETAWGNMRCGVRITAEDEYGWDLEAVVFDMEANVWELTPSRALKTIKTREGRTVLLDERSQLQARGAAVSKVKRNAILSVLPLHIKAFFEAEVRRHMAGGELQQAASPERVQRALARFEKDHQVTAATLEAYVGKPMALWIGEDIADLQGLWNALDQGETTVAEAFGGGDAPATPTGVTAPANQSHQTHPRPIVVHAKDGQLKEIESFPPPSPSGAPTPVPASSAPESRPNPPNPSNPSAAVAPSGSVPSVSSVSSVTDTPVATPPVSPGTREGRKPKRATPYVVEPTPVAMPDPTPTTPAPGTRLATEGVEEMTLRLRISTEIAGLSTPEACDAILGRIYLDKSVPREVKRDALTWISERRDVLQSAQP